ncbi:hypothetical protein [Hymenobacter volaticus]|uniref:hypothetical protein n=1 Tax=Hymenobacter volaticus TaxID=2932254 RepID=UPI0035CB1399
MRLERKKPRQLAWPGLFLFGKLLATTRRKSSAATIRVLKGGKLCYLASLLVGHFNNPQDNTVLYGQMPNGIIQHYANQYDFLVASNFLAGHEPRNMTLIYRGAARITANESGVQHTYC